MTPTNEVIAQRLRKHANDLARSGSNLYRVRAFRSAAIAVMGLHSDVTQMVASGGVPALESVPGIGKSLALTIAEYVTAMPFTAA